MSSYVPSLIRFNVTARCSYEFISAESLFGSRCDRAMRFQSKTHISPLSTVESLLSEFYGSWSLRSLASVVFSFSETKPMLLSREKMSLSIFISVVGRLIISFDQLPVILSTEKCENDKMTRKNGLR